MKYINFLFMTLVLLAASTLTAAEKGQSVQFSVDATQTGKKIGNKPSNINIWMMQGLGDRGKDEGGDSSRFVEYIQFMQATGSSVPRELFKNPTDTSVLDDYNFAPLNKACRQALKLGIKPMIKFSVPMKYSPDGSNGAFSTNVYPPNDYEVYYKFVCALAKNLVDQFGRDEVRKWRFGVLTEFENADWFKARNGNPEESKNAFLKLYDYTVEGLIQEIAPDVFVGAHAMSCVEGLWDERELLTHCAKGTNYKTGKKGTRICYMAISYYDYTVGKPNKVAFPDVIEKLRARAIEVGLNNLIYGVDEGRVLSGIKGANSTALATRIVGYSWQGALDAKHYFQMVEHDIDYFSSWSLSSQGPFSGYPTVAFHVADLFSQFKDSVALKIETKKSLSKNVETGAVAGFDSATNTLRLMAFNFKDAMKYNEKLAASFTVKVPQFAGKTVTVVENLIDDSVNFFPQWLKDRKKYDIGDNCFSWSPEDPTIDSITTLNDPVKKKLYREKLRPTYVKLAQRKPKTSTAKVADDGRLTLKKVLTPQGVLFYEITPVK